MFDRLEKLIGKEKLEKLHSKTVAVIGLGGVGGYALESLVRSVLYTDTFRTENIILVDLNSTDDTNEILRKINEKSEQIKIMNWKEVEKFLNK